MPERKAGTALPERNFCSEYSRAAEESLAGTAKPVDLWLLVEYRARWQREAIDVFSSRVQERISHIRSAIPRMRLALIRQTGRSSGPVSVFWAFSRERDPRLYRAEFETHEDISFDLERLVDPVEGHLFAVCTHGTHDACCARFGNKIYSQMRAVSGNVWQISHIGGCRFAPNVVCLPHGIVYGRVERDDCTEIISRYNQGSLLPPKLRGRSCYSKTVQIAEQFLRSTKAFLALDELNLESEQEVEPGYTTVTFAARDLTLHRIAVALQDSQTSTYKSCAALELTPRKKFTLFEIT